VTIERPLRLRYQMTPEDKVRFLDVYPELLDDIQAIDKAVGRGPSLDWNSTWVQIDELLRDRQSRWKSTQERLFRTIFTRTDPSAEPVIKSGRGQSYEPDPDLRDFENVPLKMDIAEFFKREVLPYVPDAWMDRSKDKIGYEINFNRHFYKFTPPRALEEIDQDLKEAEQRILKLMQEVTA
jgi:type I restriction enzyme M protein